MKLLIDQNISHRIIQKIRLAYLEAVHVKDSGMNDRNDPEIFMFARKEGYEAVVTLDEDFFNLHQRHGTPPK